MRNRRAIIYSLIGVAFLAVRIPLAHTYPPQIDELIHLSYTYRFAASGSIEYIPWVHGPAFFYVTVPILPNMGYDLGAARLLVATLGLTGILAAALYDRVVSRALGIYIAVIVTFHPYFIRLSLEFRRDIIGVGLLLLFVALYHQLRMRDERRTAVFLGIVGGILISLTETAWVHLALIAAGAVTATGLTVLTTTDEPIEKTLQESLPLNHVGEFVVSTGVVVLFFYAGWPVTLHGIISVPFEFQQGIEQWLQVTKQSPNPDLYMKYARSVPLLSLSSILGIMAVYHDETRHLATLAFVWTLGAWTIFPFSASHATPMNFLYLATPLILLGGLGLSSLPISNQSITVPPVLGRVVLAVALSGLIVTPAVAGPKESIQSDYFQYSSYTGGQEIFDLTRGLAVATNCTVTVDTKAFDTAWAPEWYLRETPRNLTKEIPATESIYLTQGNASLPWRTNHINISNHTIYWPTTGCER